MNIAKQISVAAAITGLFATSASAGFAYLQDFNGLGTTSSSITGSGATGAQGTIPGLTGWQGGRIAGSGTTTMSLIIDNNGTSTSGGISSVGTSSTATDRSLGGLASGAASPAFGVVLTNTEAYALNSITITYTGEQWRAANGSGAVANTLAFAFGFGGGSTSSTNFLTSAGMTADSRGNVVSGVATSTPYNVYASSSISFTITGINWASGQELYLRWQIAKMTGSGATLAIDDLSVTAVPAPGAVALVGMAGLLTSRRRK